MAIEFKHNTIMKFEGDYRWLSNFWPCDVYGWPTVEHAYQASKSTDLGERQLIMQCQTPGQAKRLGQKVNLRPDWNKIRIEVMGGLIQAKFSIVNGLLMQLLIDTGDYEIVEGNTWGDTFWGISNGLGENNLGKLIMFHRNILQQTQAPPEWKKVP